MVSPDQIFRDRASEVYSSTRSHWVNILLTFKDPLSAGLHVCRIQLAAVQVEVDSSMTLTFLTFANEHKMQLP